MCANRAFLNGTSMRDREIESEKGTMHMVNATGKEKRNGHGEISEKNGWSRGENTLNIKSTPWVIFVFLALYLNTQRNEKSAHRQSHGIYCSFALKYSPRRRERSFNCMLPLDDLPSFSTASMAIAGFIRSLNVPKRTYTFVLTTIRPRLFYTKHERRARAFEVNTRRHSLPSHRSTHYRCECMCNRSH